MSQILYDIELSFYKLRFYIVVRRKVLKQPYLERIDQGEDDEEAVYQMRSTEQKRETKLAIRQIKQMY